MAASPALPRFDPDGYLDFDWMLAPPAGKRATGRPPAAVLQRACVQMYEGEDVATQLAAVQQAIEAQDAG